MALLTALELLLVCDISPNMTQAELDESKNAKLKTSITAFRTQALALINDYAVDAPDDAKNLAMERLVGYLWQMNVPISRKRYTSSPFRESGASSALAPWRKHRAGAI